VEGMYRFLWRVWRFVTQAVPVATEATKTIRHKTIKKVTEDLDRFHFNTGISALMEYLNFLQNSPVSKEDLEAIVLLFSPFAPHAAEELWAFLGHKELVSTADWPVYDEMALKSAKVILVVQVNGTVRGKITAPAGLSEEEAKALALTEEKVKKMVLEEGKSLVKLIYIPNKLVNFVIQ
jgi:leucyl-tRNA synthetase